MQEQYTNFLGRDYTSLSRRLVIHTLDECLPIVIQSSVRTQGTLCCHSGKLDDVEFANIGDVTSDVCDMSIVSIDIEVHTKIKQCGPGSRSAIKKSNTLSATHSVSYQTFGLAHQKPGDKRRLQDTLVRTRGSYKNAHV